MAVMIGIYSLLRIILIMRSYFYTYRGKCIRDWSNSPGLLQSVINRGYSARPRCHKAPARPAARAEKSPSAGCCMRCPSACLPGVTPSPGWRKKGRRSPHCPVYICHTHSPGTFGDAGGAGGVRAVELQGTTISRECRANKP